MLYKAVISHRIRYYGIFTRLSLWCFIHFMANSGAIAAWAKASEPFHPRLFLISINSLPHWLSPFFALVAPIGHKGRIAGPPIHLSYAPNGHYITSLASIVPSLWPNNIPNLDLPPSPQVLCPPRLASRLRTGGSFQSARSLRPWLSPGTRGWRGNRVPFPRQSSPY